MVSGGECRPALCPISCHSSPRRNAGTISCVPLCPVGLAWLFTSRWREFPLLQWHYPYSHLRPDASAVTGNSMQNVSFHPEGTAVYSQLWHPEGSPVVCMHPGLKDSHREIPDIWNSLPFPSPKEILSQISLPDTILHSIMITIQMAKILLA